jgi:hypothetical protein
MEQTSRKPSLKLLTTPSAQLSKPSRAELLPQIEMLMKQVAATFPNQQINPPTALLWADLWCELAEGLGLELFRAGLRRHCLEGRFLPMPGDINDQCKRILEERAEKRAEAAVAARRKRDADQVAYWNGVHDEIKMHPEKFVPIAPLFKAALDKHRAKRASGGS